jgi:hypothetical protein
VGRFEEYFMPEYANIIEFDEARAMRYSPVRDLEFVRIIEKPDDEETVITTKFTGRESFVGSYVVVEDPETEDDVLYAYSYDRFLETHTPWEGIEDEEPGVTITHAYESRPVDAYQADTEGELLTGSRGATQHVNVGDWIFRDGTGIWCTSAENFSLFCDLRSARQVPREPES